MGAIYAIENKRDNRAYIGSTKNVRERWSCHQSKLRHGRHGNPHLQRAWDKHGREIFELVILEEAILSNQLIRREQYWMDEYRMIGEIYNCGPAAEAPWKGRKHTPEARRRISRTLTGKPKSEEHRRKMSMANGGPYPAFRNRYTGETIPAGRNLVALCRERELQPSSMWRVIHSRQGSHGGWELLDGPPVLGARKGKPYPAFRHRETGEIIPVGHNLAALCQERGLNNSRMCQVARGRQPSHKGWILKIT